MLSPLVPLRALALLGCALLAACGPAGDVGASAPLTTRIVARPGYSPRGATLAFAPIEGAPASVAQRFTERATAEAAAQGIETAPSGQAKYVARGYLSAAPNETGGVTLSCVWDLFDAQHRRLQRVENNVVAKSASDDPWSADDSALTSLAVRSADDLAAILTNTPEAQPGALPQSASAYR